MLQRDWFQIGKNLGLSFSFGRFLDPDAGAYLTKGDHMLNIWNLARATLRPLRDIWTEYPDNQVCNFDELEYFIKQIQRHKHFIDRIDYTDILERFVSEKPFMTDVAYMIVDETQDLSNLQTKVVEHIGGFTKDIWLGGDDDQCVHEWNGANAKWFIDLPAKLQVLNQSYRVPIAVHAIAEKISARISNRIDKPYEPRNEKGLVERRNPEDLEMGDGKWFVLCRNKSLFEYAEELCFKNGWSFKGSKNHGDDEFLKAARIHAKLADGEIITVPEAQLFYAFISRTHVKYGGKKQLSEAPKSEMLTYIDLIKRFGLKDLKPVFDMLDRGTEKQRSYLKNLIDEKKLLEEPRIEISTIHNSKGRECVNVAIFQDISFKTWKSFQENPDCEHRVFYVGVTRAINRLVILNPITEKYYAIT